MVALSTCLSVKGIPAKANATAREVVCETRLLNSRNN